jgi:hypothetical protein
VIKYIRELQNACHTISYELCVRSYEVAKYHTNNDASLLVKSDKNPPAHAGLRSGAGVKESRMCGNESLIVIPKSDS